MADAAAVRIVKGVGGLERKRYCGSGVRGGERGGRFTLDELHRKIRKAAGLARTENRDDARMVQSRGETGLVHEARDALRVASEDARKHLHRDTASERNLLGLVDSAHAATTDEAHQSIVAPRQVWKGVRATLPCPTNGTKCGGA